MNQLSSTPNWGPPEIQPHELEIISLLGDGSFGKVYRGRCRSKDVAVKVLHQEYLIDEATIDSFRKEVEIVR
jgi:serine/threonine protein kinase